MTTENLTALRAQVADITAKRTDALNHGLWDLANAYVPELDAALAALDAAAPAVNGWTATSENV